MAEIASEIGKIGTRVDPVACIRNGDESGRVDVRVGALDDHVASRVHEGARRVARVGLQEPDDDGDVVGYGSKRDGDGPIGAEEAGGATVVVREGAYFGPEGWEFLEKGEDVLSDRPLHVFGVGESGRAALGEGVVQELLGRRH